MTVVEQMTSLIMPLLIVFPPAFILYSLTEDFLGMIVGATVGATIGVYASIVPVWVLIVLILALVSFLFRQTNVLQESGK